MKYTLKDLERDLKELDKKIKDLEKIFTKPKYLKYTDESEIIEKLIAPVYFARYMQLIGKYLGLEQVKIPMKVKSYERDKDSK